MFLSLARQIFHNATQSPIIFVYFDVSLHRRLPPGIYNQLPWRTTQQHAAVSNAVVSILFGGDPSGATRRVGRAIVECWRRVGHSTGAFGGAPYGARAGGLSG